MPAARSRRPAPPATKVALQLLDLDQVGEILGVSRDSVESLISGGDLQAVDVRAQGTRPRLRVSETALADFIHQRTLPTPQSASRTPRPRRRRESA